MQAADRVSAGPFDYTAHMRRLCDDIVSRLPPLAHVDMARVAVSFAQTRKNVAHGLYATLTPLRFAGGAHTERRQGRWWRAPRLVDPAGRELLYILSFYLPRFQDASLRQKLVTVLHELWHISPEFNGDLRRHPGRCYAHTASQKQYDAEMEQLVDRWLAADPPGELYAFLRDDFTALARRHGAIVGLRLARPKLIPLAS